MRSLRSFLLLALAHLLTLPSPAAPLSPREVLVIFNSADPDSARLAEAYQRLREIPPSQVLGFDLPRKPDITRAEYNSSILNPLRSRFERESWWNRQRDSNGLLLPASNRIRAIVVMRGVPLRILPDPTEPNPAANPGDAVSTHDEASVDSELALFAIETLPTKGVLKNAFFESKTQLSSANFPFLILVTRIDAPDYGTCARMIRDAVETEKSGLWGLTYIDIANKFPVGDLWLNEIVAENIKLGLPTVTDRFNDTFPKNYPLTRAALYYGWYDGDVSGPFLNPTFQFQKGAVAVHLHSFSAQQLTDPHRNWSAALLVRGATATLGNVFEPYLHLTHHLGTFHDRLLKGWTLAEAAWAAMPVTSWQGVVLGDPLYRPFLHISGTGEKLPDDREFRILRAASRQWPDETALRREKISAAAEKLSSGALAEALALDYYESKDLPNTRTWLNRAKSFYLTPDERLRQDLQLIALDREAGNKQAAISALQEARQTYGNIPSAEALAGWLDILDPPAPPPADPTRVPASR